MGNFEFVSVRVIKVPRFGGALSIRRPTIMLNQNGFSIRTTANND